MISIINLFEKQYEPWMVGTPKQLGGKGYPTADLRMTKAAPSQEMAKQSAEEDLVNAEKLSRLSQLRTKKNLTAAQRMQLGL